MGLSLPHLIVLALVVLLLFGRGKISELMGDMAQRRAGLEEAVQERIGALLGGAMANEAAPAKCGLKFEPSATLTPSGAST